MTSVMCKQYVVTIRDPTSVCAILGIPVMVTLVLVGIFPISYYYDHIYGRLKIKPVHIYIIIYPVSCN